MAGSPCQLIRSVAVKLTAAGRRHRARPLDRHIISVAVSALVFLGLVAQGRLGQTRAAPVVLQQPATTQPAAATSLAPHEVEAATARRDALERLKALQPTTTADLAPAGSSNAKPASSPSTGSAGAGSEISSVMSLLATAGTEHAARKLLPDLLNDRVRWLEEYDKVSKVFQRVTHPVEGPEQQAALANTELDRLQSKLIEAQKSPETLLPPSLAAPSPGPSQALESELKEALATTTSELKDWQSRIENLRSEISKSEVQQNARRAERDKVFQWVASLKVKKKDFEGAVTDALNADARQLAHERLVNFQWEERVATLCLQTIEAQLALDAKLAGVREVERHIYHVRAQLCERTLEQMKARYNRVSEDQERRLTAAAASEEKKAQSSQDPLERFRARRTAELKALEAQVLKLERLEATSPSPSYEEQRALADRAEKDFAGIKELLDDGRISRLDAIRLNNDFRRIGPERERLVRNEMSIVEAQLQFYEDALTNVEIELIQDSLHDRFEHDLLRERVPADRWTEGETILNELERKHRELLIHRRIALEKLSERTSHTLQQVMRRLNILDEEYGFIRTQIFWVRDQDPVGPATLAQASREFNYMLKGLLRLAQEIAKPGLWGQPSAEFLVAVLMALALPLAVIRLRKGIWFLLKRDLPAQQV